MRALFLYLLLLYPAFVQAQAIDNSFAYKSINSDKYLRANYDNDYFSARDRFYTQGVHIEFVHPVFRHNPVNILFPTFRGVHTKYGIAIEHDAYTPTSIQSNFILYGDRPFAAALMLKSFAFAVNEGHNQKLSTALSLGVLGPAAGGREIQNYIHENTGNIIPQGWQYQVQNSPIINYQLNYERQLLSVKNYLLLNADGMIRAGTLSDKLSAGTTLMLGYFDPPFSDAREKVFSLYAYDHPAINAIAYDATLQGGLFNDNSPYTIAAKDISRLCFENRFGVALAYKWLHVEYFQTYLTKEFATQRGSHRWGGIQIAISPL